MTTFRHLALIYGSALVFMVFSEMVFFNEGPAYSVIGTLNEPLALALLVGELGLWYSVVAAPVIWAIRRFKVRNLWSLFLAGLLFGYFTEGLIIPAMYHELPQSLIWVAGSWHPIGVVLVGWYGLRLLLQSGRYRLIAPAMAGLGAFWGSWPTILIGASVDQEVAGNLVHVGEVFAPLPGSLFFGFALVTAAVWIAGNLLIDAGRPGDYAPGRIEQGGIGALTIAAFAIMVATVQAYAGILLVAVGIVWVGLARNRRVETRPDVLSQFRPIPPAAYLLVPVAPLVATAVYVVMTAAGVYLEPAFYALPLAVGGVAMFVLSFLRLFSRAPVAHPGHGAA